jgi:hypothetical protein
MTDHKNSIIIPYDTNSINVEISYGITGYETVIVGRTAFISPALGYDLMKNTKYDPIKLLDLLKYKVNEDIKTITDRKILEITCHLQRLWQMLDIHQQYIKSLSIK